MDQDHWQSIVGAEPVPKAPYKWTTYFTGVPTTLRFTFQLPKMNLLTRPWGNSLVCFFRARCHQWERMGQLSTCSRSVLVPRIPRRTKPSFPSGSQPSVYLHPLSAAENTQGGILAPASLWRVGGFLQPQQRMPSAEFPRQC